MKGQACVLSASPLQAPCSKGEHERRGEQQPAPFAARPAQRKADQGDQRAEQEQEAGGKQAPHKDDRLDDDQADGEEESQRQLEQPAQEGRPRRPVYVLSLLHRAALKPTMHHKMGALKSTPSTK